MAREVRDRGGVGRRLASGATRRARYSWAVTSALQRAFDEASKLPEREQDFIAALVMEGIESERRWDDAFANSQDVLERLDDEAQAHIDAGRLTPIDPERM